MKRAMTPAARDALNAAQTTSTAVRAERCRAGKAWALAWRDRNRPVFDRMEADGCFLPEGLAR